MATSNPVINAWGRWRRTLAFREFCRTHPLGAKEVGIIMQHGVGDHVLVAGLAAAIGRQYGVKVVLAGRPGMKFVAELFPSVTRYAELPEACVGQEVGATVIAPQTWSYGHFRGMELARVVGYKSMGLLDAYRCLFRLSQDARLERPRLPDASERDRANAFLRQRGCQPGRTVYFSRKARSTPVPMGSEAMFNELSRQLSAKGYSILENEGEGVNGVVTPEIPLPLLRALVAEAGGFVAVRNGLCDLLCDLPVTGSILYADAIYLGGSLYDGTNVAGYGFGDHLAEYVVGDGAGTGTAEVVPKVVKRIADGMVAEATHTTRPR